MLVTLQNLAYVQITLRWLRRFVIFIPVISLLHLVVILSDEDTHHLWLEVVTFALIVTLAISIFGILTYLERVTQQVKTHAQTDYDRLAVGLQVAAQTARDASAKPDLNTLLESAVQLIHERFGFYHVGIFLVDDAHEYAILRAAAGGEASQGMVERQHKLKVGEMGIIGYVTRTGEARIAPDVRHDERHYSNPALPNTRSEMAVPLKVQQGVIGALDIQSLDENAFNPDDILILQTLADLLAVAIEKAHLHQALQLEAERLEQRIAERTTQLATERAHLSAILETMSDGVVFREDQQTQYINPAFTQLLGYNRANWQGLLSILDVASVSPDDAKARHAEIVQVLQTNGQWQGELRVHRQDKSELEMSIRAWLIRRDSHHVGSLLVLRDISQEKALQEQKNRFVSYASHELRTPLTNLTTRLYLLEKQPHRFSEHIQTIHRVTARMRRLVDDLLDTARFESGKIQLERDINVLQELIADVVATQRPEAERKHHLLSTHYPDFPLRASIDHDRMTQVLTNLIANAINYTPDGGRITVTLTKAAYDWAEICIEDSGIGIPADYLPKVFMPFVRAGNVQEKGTGLGLTIARQIVEQHNGEIRVESEPGKGSRFCVRLQLASHTSTSPTF